LIVIVTCWFASAIELNQVGAGMVNHPAEYRWSSYHSNRQDKDILCDTPRDLYLQLGHTKIESCESYKLLFERYIRPDVIEKLRNHLCHNYLLGESNGIRRLFPTFFPFFFLQAQHLS
jgi:putative transposase